jgi:hypothetical protein
VFDTVKFVGHETVGFQGDTPTAVLRLVWFEVRGEWRLCLHLRYPDGREDLYPLDEAARLGCLRRASECVRAKAAADASTHQRVLK